MNVVEAKLFLKVEDDVDDEQIKKDLDSAKSIVNQYLYPRSINATEDGLKLSDEEKVLAEKGIQYALHHFYYNRDGLNNKDFTTNLMYILQPIRTLQA